MPTSVVRVDVHLGPDDLASALRTDARRGLTSVPKQIPPKWFYDERGSRLFDEITRLPEYYPTRCEREILGSRARAIADASGADTLVELGSGTADKTRVLLDALFASGRLRRYVPFDVSEEVLRSAAETINATYDGVEVHAVVGDFERHLDEIPDGDGRRLFAFLGGTIGNLPPDPRRAFLRELAETMHDGDGLLLGCDLVKDHARLHAAYNDSRGVTAEFNRNVLRVLNDQLGADFAPERFEHVAFFDPSTEQVEMRLRSDGQQSVYVRELGLDVAFRDGEEMRTEISAKFRPEGIESELQGAGLHPVELWTDPADDFAVALARR